MRTILFVGLLAAAVALQAQPRYVPVELTVTSDFRGLSVVDDQVAWVSGSKGHVGKSVDGGKTWTFQQVAGYEKLDWRSLYGFDKDNAVIANAGSPAVILRTTDGGATWKEVYRNEDKDAFFDGGDFWDAQHGVMYGDPIGGKMLLMFTSDGGHTWSMATDAQRPALAEGEASFAASGTGIRCVGKMLVVATGGKVSRLWISNDRGQTWTMRDIPIVQGTQAAGIFSVAINGRKWVVVGGDFQNDRKAPKQAFYSTDGGKTWVESAETVGGWREGAEWIDKRTLLTTGPTGTEISGDGGRTWQSLFGANKLNVVRKARKGKLVVMAGSSRIGRLD